MDTILFSPETLGNLKLKNRLVVPPMCTWKAKDGMVLDFHLHHYAMLASSGVAAVTIEATAVSPNGRISPWCLGIWDEERAQGISKIVKTIHDSAQDVKVILQIAHAGRKGSCSPETDSTVPQSLGAWQTVAPSAISPKDAVAIPHELLESEIKDYVKAFADAAKRAVLAGVDAIEIHAAHGYLIHEFLSPLSNKRKDNYGGSFENRSRFALEIIEAVLASVPKDFPVGIRVSATDYLEGGVTLEEIIKLLKLAQDLGLVFADISTGGLLPCKIPLAPGYQLPYAKAVKEQTKLKVLGVGLITNAFQAETALQLQACDFIDIGRAILSDPNFGFHAARDVGAQLENVPGEKVFALKH